MIGIIVITHGNFGKEMLFAAENIIGNQQNIKFIKISSNGALKIFQNMLKKAFKELSNCDGVIMFTDMFGGTPCNICLPFTKMYNIEIVSGINLYMLITALLYRDKISLKELTKKVIEAGQKNIADVKEEISRINELP